MLPSPKGDWAGPRGQVVGAALAKKRDHSGVFVRRKHGNNSVVVVTYIHHTASVHPPKKEVMLRILEREVDRVSAYSVECRLIARSSS